MSIDDGAFVSDGSRPHGDTKQMLEAAADALEQLGFVVPDRRGPDDIDKIVGYVPVRRPAQLRPRAQKLALLHLAFFSVIAASHVNVGVLRSLVGLWLWMALLRRDRLSVAHALFRFLDGHEKGVVPWWEYARREVKTIKNLLPYAWTDIGAPLAKILFATDAM